MIRATTLQFLKDLKKNNDRSWMEKNKPRYEEARENFLSFVSELIAGAGTIDPDIATLETKQSVFRINRDIRFSKNKSPYKTNFAAFLCRGGKNSGAGGYYVHLEPGGCFLAGGLYMPGPEVLAAIRQEIDYCLPEWESILKNSSFKKTFPAGLDQEHLLSRPPKGYDADNPALPYLKLKSFTISKDVDDQFFTNKNSVSQTVAIFKTLRPMVAFLNRASG